MATREEVFRYQDGSLRCEDCSVEAIADGQPTPFYVYSSTCVRDRYRRLHRAFTSVPHLICYAFKANSQPALLRLLVEEGAGAEVVSGAELALARAVGFSSEKIVFSGVGKTESELRSGLEADVRFFTVESEGELDLLERLAARLGSIARVAIRINPNIDPRTHPNIATGVSSAKFGLDPETALDLYGRRDEFPHLAFRAIHVHIGSQLTAIEPMAETSRLLEGVVEELRARGLALEEVDWGGGLAIAQDGEKTPSFEEYARLICPWISRSGARLVIEPGRALVGPAGALVVRVLYLKEVYGHRYAVVDSGMNDLLRPALYGAYHRIVPVVLRDEAAEPVDVVGAVCESSDVFGRDRDLGRLQAGDLLAVLDTGAYGYSMTSNYNLRPRPAEVVVEGETFRVVRRAETTNYLVTRELG